MSVTKTTAHVSTVHIHDCVKVRIQRDLQHQCIDIVIHGSADFPTTRISLWGTPDEIPSLLVLEDVEAETDAETNA